MGELEQLDVYRSCTPVVNTRYEIGGVRTVTEAIVDAIAEAEGIDATDLPPLYDAIDLDTVTQLFERRDGTAGGETVLSFAFGRWNVFVRADGRICVCDSTRRTDPEPVFVDG